MLKNLLGAGVGLIAYLVVGGLLFVKNYKIK
jgi:hypothetical protein